MASPRGRVVRSTADRGEEGPLAKAVIPQGLPVHTVITPPELGKAYRIQYPGRKR